MTRSRRTGSGSLERRRVQPEGRIRPARSRGGADAVDAGDGRVVACGDVPPGREQPVELLELRQTERRRDVREPVVVADLVVVVGEAREAGLGREVARPPGERLVVGDDHPAAAGRDELVAVEAERAEPADRADVPARVLALGVARAQRLRRVLDDRDAVSSRGRDDRRRSAPDARRGGRARSRRAGAHRPRRGGRARPRSGPDPGSRSPPPRRRGSAAPRRRRWG